MTPGAVGARAGQPDCGTQPHLPSFLLLIPLLPPYHTQTAWHNFAYTRKTKQSKTPLQLRSELLAVFSIASSATATTTAASISTVPISTARITPPSYGIF